MASSLAAIVLLAVASQRLHSPPPNGLNWEGIYIGQFMRYQWKAQYCTVLHRYIKMGPIKAIYLQKTRIATCSSPPGVSVPLFLFICNIYPFSVYLFVFLFHFLYLWVYPNLLLFSLSQQW